MTTSVQHTLEGANTAAVFPIAELFTSINGEGPDAGKFATFVRFTGCNLSCSYCDTQWACATDCPATTMSAQDIVDYVLAQGTPCVTITGGEPLLQPALPVLLEALVRNTTCHIEIETNGSCLLKTVDMFRKMFALQGFANRVSFTMDWKLPSSGMMGRMNGFNFGFLSKGDSVKFVAGSQEDLETAARIIKQYGLFEKCQVFFSPVFGAIEPAEIVAFLQEQGLMQARVQLQLHKLIWPGVEKGV